VTRTLGDEQQPVPALKVLRRVTPDGHCRVYLRASDVGWSRAGSAVGGTARRCFKGGMLEVSASTTPLLPHDRPAAPPQRL
jgi:hypothetical protein